MTLIAGRHSCPSCELVLQLQAQLLLLMLCFNGDSPTRSLPSALDTKCPNLDALLVACADVPVEIHGFLKLH